MTGSMNEPTWLKRLDEAPHNKCYRAGKFNCDFDERISEMLADSGAGEGDVESPTGWFEEVTLDALCEGHPDDEWSMNEPAGVTHHCDGSCRRGEGERELAVHYGTPWIITRQDNYGFFWVNRYSDESTRDADLERLRKDHEWWAAR